MPKVLALRQSSYYQGLERLMVESAAMLTQQRPEWQVDLLHLYTRRGITMSQRAALPTEHAIVGEARRRGLQAWQWDDAGRFVPGEMQRLARFVREGGYDLIHTHEYKSDLMGAMLRLLAPVRVVATVHGYPKGLRRLRLYRTLDRWLLRCFDHVITVSESLRREMLVAGLRAERLTTVHNAIDVKAFRAQAHAGAGTPARNGAAPIVTTVARLSAEKGVEYFLESAALLHARFPAARFWVVGDGPLRPRLEAQARQLGLADPPIVSFLGQRPDVAWLMAASDVVVLPSLNEAFGVVLLEAMAVGKPVVATRVDGIPEIIEDGVNGLLVPPADGPALAAATVRLLQDHSLTAALVQRGTTHVETNFDVAAMTARTRAVYERVLAA